MDLKFQKRLLFVTVSLFFMSCMGPRITITEDTTYDQPVAETESPYILGEGDVIELIYYFESWPSEKEYVLAVGDVINVEFYYHPDANKTVTIRPDGKITLPLKGDVAAGGFTPSQLKEQIERLYGETFQNPVVTITLTGYDQAVRQIQETLSSDLMGQAKKVAIRPDGYVSLPLIMGDIRAAGLTLPQLKKSISMEYRKINDRLSVSLVLDEIKSNVVYVTGEVKKPDYYRIDGPTTVTQILARAGGVLDTGKTDNILVLSMNQERKPVGKLVDLDDSLGKGNIGNDLLLKQYDVVFVPKSAIAKVDLFVEQYINQIVPKAVRLGWTYDLND